MRETRGIPTALLVLLAAIVAVVLLIHVLHRGSGAPAHYAARPALTPGALNPEVTPATTHSTICSRGWTTTIRPPSSFTSELKLEQMRVYGFTGGPAEAGRGARGAVPGHDAAGRECWNAMVC